MRLFHKWSKWEEYTWTGYHIPMGIMYGELRGQKIPVTVQRQKRRCSVCGKIQDREVMDDG